MTHRTRKIKEILSRDLEKQLKTDVSITIKDTAYPGRVSVTITTEVASATLEFSIDFLTKIVIQKKHLDRKKTPMPLTYRDLLNLITSMHNLNITNEL